MINSFMDKSFFITKNLKLIVKLIVSKNIIYTASWEAIELILLYFKFIE